MKVSLDIVGGYGISVSPQMNSETTINYYITYDPNGKKPAALIFTPGILLAYAVEVGSSTIREGGIYKSFGYFFVVADQNVYRYSSDGDKLNLGPLTTSSGPISWANTNSVTGQLALADGVNLFIYNNATSIMTVTNLATLFPSPQSVYFQDLRFIVSCANLSTYPFSAQGDGTSWNALNFLTQESRPDVSMGITGTNERLFLLGQISTEIWAPVTTPSDLPFYRDNNLLFEIGLASVAGFVKGTIDKGIGQPVVQFIFWLATNPNGGPTFVISEGGPPIKVSDEFVDLLLGGIGFVVSDCNCTIYKENSHTFIECSFPTENITLLYDATVEKFTEIQRLNNTYSLVNSHVYYNNRHIVGSRLTGDIYYLSNSYLTENGTEIKRTRITKTFSDPTYSRMQLKWLEVDFESGTAPEGITPYAFMSFSVDDGITFSTPVKKQMGKVGQYHYKTYWNNLGSGYSYTFKIEVYDPIRVIILGAAIEYEIYSV